MTESPAYQFQSGKRFAVVEFHQPLASCRWSEIEQIGDALKSEINSLSNPAILIDLSRLDYIGSSIVALIVRLWKAVQERGGGMVIVSTSDMTREVLEIAGLTRVWTVVDSREEAESFLSGSPYSAGAISRSVFLLTILGWVSAAGAVFGTVALRREPPMVDPRTALLITWVGGGVAALCGLTLLIASLSVWRLLGLLLLIIAGSLLGVATMS